MKSELKIRNIICDYYFLILNQFNLCKYGKTKQKSLQLAFPTMRIFGILDSGQKCCAHVHGYLPYVTMRTRSPLTTTLHNILTNIIVECNGNNIFELKDKPKLDLDEIILGIFAERGRSIYGFDESNDFFIKIYFYNPLFAKAFATILQEQSKQFQWLQPFNIHIPFTLQFFIDFSLHGMDYVHLENVYYRRGSQNIQENSKISPLGKMSKCAVEFDIFTDDILNPVICKKNRIFESIGLDFIWKEEQRRCETLKMKAPKLPENNKTKKEERNINDLFTNKCKKEFKEILDEFKLINSIEGGGEQQNQEEEFHLTFLENNENNFGINYETMLQMEIGNYSTTSPNHSSQRFWENVEYRSMGFDVDDFDDALEEDEEEEQNLTSTLDESQIILSSEEQNENEMEENINGVMEESSTTNAKTNVGINIEKLDELLNISPKCAHPLIPKRIKLPIINENSNKTPQNHQQQRHPFCWQKPFCPTPRTPLSLGSSIYKSKNIANAEDLLLRDAQSNVDNLCVLSLEILTFPANGSKRPIADPIYDQIYALLFSYHSDICNCREEDGQNEFKFVGIAIKEYWEKESKLLEKLNGKILMVENEMELLKEAAKFILKLDPELLIGYDTKRFSWGYLFERAKLLQISFKSTISRIKDSNGNMPKTPFLPPYGRLFLEVWWNVRRERPLRSFRLGNVTKELLDMKFPELDSAYLSEMFSNNQIGIRTTIFKYFMRKSLLNLQILCKLDIFVRTCQMARVYGIQFEGVLTRGSQFRVESMLLRLASQRHIFAPSVSVDQRTKMVSPEFIPLNIEPRAGLYLDPVIVLDFQSLYPSISIAYNYCFNTCLGKISNYKNLLNILSNSNINSGHKYNILLGALNYQICQLERLMELLDSNQLTFAPNGAIFVKRNIRIGLLPIMLTELLDTRVMVKNAMKIHAKNNKLTRLLAARQLALKLIANVTYGYTAANWSGRMPCEEVADAIVSKGRETLEKAIEEIDEAPFDKYKGAKVIYGDTDSVFVICKGLSREEAFIIGQQIADDITSQNPYPVKLKFEKIMHPCCLMAKKRYMGMSYENAEDEKGKFDSKGIETIRRDSPPFVARVMEHFLGILFNESIISALDYLKNRLNRIEFTELDEFFLSVDYIGDYSEMSKSPANKIGRELSKLSERLTPLYGERLVYVITQPKQQNKMEFNDENNPSTYLANTISVDNFLRNSNLRLDLDYYIQHQLFPALQRVLDNIPLKLDLRFFKSDDHNQQQNPIQLLFGDEDARTTIRKIYIKKGNMMNTIEKLKRICNECIGPVKSIEIEGFPQCSNHNCPVKRKAAATEKILSKEENVLINFFLYNS